MAGLTITVNWTGKLAALKKCLCFTTSRCIEYW